MCFGLDLSRSQGRGLKCVTYLHTGARSSPSFNKITDDITLGDYRGGRKGSRTDCVLEETEPGDSTDEEIA